MLLKGFFATIALLGFYISIPPFWAVCERNVAGNSDYEELKQECAIGTPPQAVKLYEGSGTLTSFWYTLTLATPQYGERQWFWTYSEPAISKIVCSGDKVMAFAGEQKVVEVTLDEIQKAKLFKPIGFRNGKREDLAWDGKQTYASYNTYVFAFGIAVTLLGAAGFAWARRRTRKKLATAD